MFQDAVGFAGVEALFILAQGFFPGDIDVEQGRSFENLRRKMGKCPAIAAMLAAARELDEGGGWLGGKEALTTHVVSVAAGRSNRPPRSRPITLLLLVFQTDPVN